MTHEQILYLVFDVIRRCDIRSFPFECTALFPYYDYKVYTYGELRQKNEELYDFCIGYSEDAFREGNSRIVAYNSLPGHDYRTRFSLMHELGHIVMNHKGDNDHNEQDANFFASNLLAPRIAIHYSQCRTIKSLSRAFEISHEAAEYALKDYARWHNVAQHRMSALDKAMYKHFYREAQKKFIYREQRCEACGMVRYNDSPCRCYEFFVSRHRSHDSDFFGYDRYIPAWYER